MKLRQAKKIGRQLARGRVYPERTRMRALRRLHRSFGIEWLVCEPSETSKRAMEYLNALDAMIARRLLFGRGELELCVVPSEGARYPHAI